MGELSSDGKTSKSKSGYKFFQSPSVKMAGLNKSPDKILRSTNRKHAFLAMGQDEKKKLSVKYI